MHRRFFFLVTTFVTLSAVAARAELITFAFHGTPFQNYLNIGFTKSQTVHGTYTFDTAVTPSIVTQANGDFYGTYTDAVKSITITIDGVAGTATNTGFGAIRISNPDTITGIPDSTADRYSIFNFPISGIQTVGTSGICTATAAFFDLWDKTLTASNGIDLPIGPIDLSKYAYRHNFDVNFRLPNGTGTTTANFTLDFLGPYSRGDFNLDGQLTPADVPVMLNALTDLNTYSQQYVLTPLELLSIGDVNSSGAITNADIQNELDLIGGARSTSIVPEPSSITLLALGAIGLVIARHKAPIHSTFLAASHSRRTA